MKCAILLLVTFAALAYAADQDYIMLFNSEKVYVGTGEDNIGGYSPLIVCQHPPLRETTGWSLFELGELARQVFLNFATQDQDAYARQLASDCTNAGGVIATLPNGRYPKLSTSPGSIQVVITATDEMPHVSFATRLLKSPDFFFGTPEGRAQPCAAPNEANTCYDNGIWLKNADGTWKERIEFPLYGLDAGLYETTTMTKPFLKYAEEPIPPTPKDQDVDYGTQKVLKSSAGIFLADDEFLPVGTVSFYRADMKPSVTLVKPAVGEPGGGTIVTITGYGFGANDGVTVGRAVTINGEPCPIVTNEGVEQAGPFHIVCNAPANAGNQEGEATIVVSIEDAPLPQMISVPHTKVPDTNPPASLFIYQTPPPSDYSGASVVAPTLVAVTVAVVCALVF